MASSPSAGQDLEVQGALGRFLVIRACGYLEQIVGEVAREYVRRKSGGPVMNFANSWLGRTKNPTPENLLEFVGRFDLQMRESLNALFKRTISGFSVGFGFWWIGGTA